MEAIATALIAKLDVATIVLTSVVAGLGYLHIVWRREERADRQQLYAVVEAQTRAVEALRVAISLFTGKQA